MPARARAGPTRIDEGHVAGERGESAVQRPPSLQSRVTNVLVMGFLGTAALGLLGWYYMQSLGSETRARAAAQSSAQDKAKGEMALPPLGRVDPPPPGLEALLGPPPEEPPADILEAWRRPAQAPTANLGPAAGPAGKTSAELRLERRLAGPAFAAAGPERRGGCRCTVQRGPGFGRRSRGVAAADGDGSGQRAGAAHAAAAPAEGGVSRLHARDRDRQQLVRHDDLRACDGFLRRRRVRGPARTRHQARRRDARPGAGGLGAHLRAVDGGEDTQGRRRAARVPGHGRARPLGTAGKGQPPLLRAVRRGDPRERDRRRRAGGRRSRSARRATRSS